jgi:hypothetical protein
VAEIAARLEPHPDAVMLLTAVSEAVERYDPSRESAMSLSRVRSLLYRLARLLGDVNAVEKGNVPQRVERRIVGRAFGRILGRLFR